MERRVVCTKHSSVNICSGIRFLLCSSDIVRLDYLHRQYIGSLTKHLRYVGTRTHESALNAVHTLAIEEDISLPVYSVKTQEDMLAFHLFRHGERATIPEVAVKE